MNTDPFEDWPPIPPSGGGRTVAQAVLHGVGLGLLLLIFGLLISAAVALGVYAYYAASLPLPEELPERANRFKTMRILDRDGELLYEVIDPTGGKRLLVTYGDLPQDLIDAVVSTEDSSFFINPGFSPTAIVRALLANLRAGDITQGGSTITQQLVKMTLLSDEQTLERKIKEAILAAEITRRYSKEEILELYLNEVYLGNLSYGVAAAAETYFGKEVSALTLPESALLAGMLQSPYLYDPYTRPEAAKARRDTVLRMMLLDGRITMQEFSEATNTPIAVVSPTAVMQAPHFVLLVRQELEKQYGSEALYTSGWDVYTTLDLTLQRQAEQVVSAGVAGLAVHNASNGALVAIDPRSGDVLAMVGSADFNNEAISGQVNMAVSPRQPGSAIKPITYLVALERGWTASTMLMDVSQQFPDGANPPYVPHNYDETEWGPISLRDALANSRNIPAVATLNLIGLPNMISAAERLGITTFTRPDYGLSLTLGGGEATLLEMTGAYAVLANNGRAVKPQLMRRIADRQGRTIWSAPEPTALQIVDPRHAYLLTDILDDDEARRRTFGANNPLELPFPAAVKTGTTNDYRDSWTIGYTPELAIGVWVGNNDYTPMDQLSGARGAALIWHEAMLTMLGSGPRQAFARPEGLVELEICPVSGQVRTANCPAGHTELFLAENTPGACTVHRTVAVCSVSGKLAAAQCPHEQVHELRVTDLGPEWDDWAQRHGLTPPPRESCPIHEQAADKAPNENSLRKNAEAGHGAGHSRGVGQGR
ncbi:MAG: PBP1A family penicillin-binding protein [Anaerolineales bacterium]